MTNPPQKNWKYITFTHKQVLQRKVAELIEEVQGLYEVTKEKEGFCVFTRREVDDSGNLHVTVYFSPVAVKHIPLLIEHNIKAYVGGSCFAPVRTDETRAVVGDAEDCFAL